MTVEEVLTAFHDGALTRRERTTALAGLITCDNVDAVMAVLPVDVISDLERWAAEMPMHGGIVLGGNVSVQHAVATAEELRDARQVISHWIAQDRSAAASKE